MMRHLLILLTLLLSPSGHADVVKPALIEISAHTDGRIEVDMRVSVEALLTGINARYRNTQDAPNADEYDFYREMPAAELEQAFLPFHPTLLQNVILQADEQDVTLSLSQVEIPEPGYTQVPRNSRLVLTGRIPRDTGTLRWYYPARFGDNAVRVRQVDEANERWHWSAWQWIRDDRSSELFTLDELFGERPLAETVLDYIIIGFEHILPAGLDHILFIIGLFLLSPRLKPLLWQVTMFTLAHSLTLGLAMTGVIALPAQIVEPLVALSIAWIGIENIRRARLENSRLIIIFLFGLLHGLGFAGVLSEFGMPRDSFLVALISFNIGVEFGQLAIILMAFVAVYAIMHRQELYRRIVVIPVSALITLTGLFWTIERVAV